MLTPCSPCSCPGAPCEQCMFGYLSDVDKHSIMKNLIEKVLDGKKPLGYGVAESYMERHKNWQSELIDIPEEELKDEIFKEEPVHMENERLAKLQEALKLISEECSNHRYCSTCPFRSDGSNCKITGGGRPDEWDLVKEPIIPAPKLFG